MHDPVQLLRDDLRRELDLTRTVLTALPNHDLDYRSHERAFSMGELALHTANLASWIAQMARGEDYDLATEGPRLAAPASIDEVLDTFERVAVEATEALDVMTPELFHSDWHLLDDGAVLQTMPRPSAIRHWGLQHTAHHRGQLVGLLRARGHAVPGTYGPSADEMPGSAAETR